MAKDETMSEQIEVNTVGMDRYNPQLKQYLDKLEREKTQQTVDSLSKLWRCSSEKAYEVAEHLVEAGFFERKGVKDNPTYWVPFLYRDALDLLQGPAI